MYVYIQYFEIFYDKNNNDEKFFIAFRKRILVIIINLTWYKYVLRGWRL